jgi:hypothetical protein
MLRIDPQPILQRPLGLGFFLMAAIVVVVGAAAATAGFAARTYTSSVKTFARAWLAATTTSATATCFAGLAAATHDIQHSHHTLELDFAGATRMQ